MAKQRSFKTYLVILVLCLVVGSGGVYLWYAEAELPVVTVQPEQKRISAHTSMHIKVTDIPSGLRSLQVQAVQKGQSRLLMREEFEQPVQTWTDEFTLEDTDLVNGEIRLQVTATDRSWRNWLQGNEVTQGFSYIYDSKPPRISLESFQHNVRQGGAGVVAFQVSEPVQRAGVRIKDYFFPAYSQSDGLFLCFFSFPFSLEPGQGQLLITATDLAGNENHAGFHHYINDAQYAQVKLPITERFLQTTIVNFQDRFPNQKSLIDVFLLVNRKLRRQNRNQLLDFGRQTASHPLWSGRFLRQPGAARRAHFGTHRQYVYQGQVIDEQTHLGVDLASVARAEVPAANSGRVVFADWLGIYGQVVIIDHGLGLQSLYAHLSQIQASAGDEISKGQIIGRTGNTGLAGGDHLHFAMVISGIPVNPVEWWDESWIKNNIISKLTLKPR